MKMSTQPGLSTSAVAERCASSSAAAERFAPSSAAAEQFASSSADGDSAATERGEADQKRSGPMNLWNLFQHEHKGQGLSSTVLSKIFRGKKSK